MTTQREKDKRAWEAQDLDHRLMTHKRDAFADGAEHGRRDVARQGANILHRHTAAGTDPTAELRELFNGIMGWLVPETTERK